MQEATKKMKESHVSQVKLLLHTLDPKGDDITKLVQEAGDIIWESWVLPQMEGVQSSRDH